MDSLDSDVAHRVIILSTKGSTSMTCREFIEFLWRYLEDELSPTERLTFDDHIAACPDCKRYLQQYRDTVRMGKQAVASSDAPVPPDVPEELVQAILQSQRRIVE